MRKIFFTIVVFSILCVVINAQGSWQIMSDPESGSLAANFKSPPPEYGMILWWGWDGPMTDTVIKRELDRIKAMGFRGVMIEAGYGMTAKYLSTEWFLLVKQAVDEAKKRNMIVWVEDEGKYPSGFAGGKFSNERPDLKMQGLVVTGKIDVTPGETVTKKLPPYAVSAAAFNNDDNTTRVIDISSGEINWLVPEGRWQIFVAGHRFRSSQTRSVNNPTRGKDTTASLMDYLNPLATRQFLDWTHEQYKKYIGNEFGKTFLGFMGDEPDFAYTPWTPKILEEFKARKGYDAGPYLASFFVPQPNEEAKRVKADYWDVWSGLFRDNFFKVQADWCRENNIEYIVHLNHEDQIPGLVRSSGDFFRNMRYVGVPGVDVIWSQIWMDHVADYPKLASSASHLYGRPRAFTESFAAYTYRPTVPQAKWVLDYQLVRGINSVQIMFMSASTSRPRPAAAAINTPVKPVVQAPRRTSFFQSDTFPPVAEYINRATYLLSQGRPAAQTGLYFPTLSMWYSDNASNTSLLDISRQLTENQLDFDFIDEQALSSILDLENGTLINASKQAYKAIIIPSVSIISAASLEKLKSFSASGGKVIFLGTLPFLAASASFLNATSYSDFSWVLREPSGKLTPAIIGSLPDPDFKTDRYLPAVKYLHRKWADAEMYFIFNEGQAPLTFEAEMADNGKAEVWDAFGGEISSLKAAPVEGGKINTRLTLDSWETKFIIIKK
jgi:hypothetical protein